MHRVVSALLLGSALALASVLAVHSYKPHSVLAYGPPDPLCPPDDSSCSGGGPF